MDVHQELTILPTIRIHGPAQACSPHFKLFGKVAILPVDLQSKEQTFSSHMAVVLGTIQLSILVLEQQSSHVEGL